METAASQTAVVVVRCETRETREAKQVGVGHAGRVAPVQWISGVQAVEQRRASW